METIMIDTLTAQTGETVDLTKIFEGRHLNAQMLPATCPNIHRHVSATNYRQGLIQCPTCHRMWVNK